MLPADGPSILQVLLAAGNGAGEVDLPDEPPRDPTKVSFAPGALDGISTHHADIFSGDDSPRARRRFRLRRWRERPEVIMLGELRRLAEHGGEAERMAVYRSAQDDGVLATIDDVLESLADDPGLRAALAPHARWLVDEGRHRGPVKLGIALLGATGDDTDLGRLSTLARHDEFGLFCTVAFQNLLDDPVEALWATARAAQGWGKIEAVERLAPFAVDRPDLRRWLLTDGYANSVMYEYLAHTCAVAGDLAGALAPDEIDDDVLHGAGEILTAMCEPGPAEDLTDYAEGPVAVGGLLRHLARRVDDGRLADLTAVVEITRFLENPSAIERGVWPEEPQLLDCCKAILASPAWPPAVRDGFMRGGAVGESQSWELAPHFEIDLWDELFARLEADGPADARVWQLVDRADRRVRLAAWAERELPLDRIASGPAEHLFASGPHREAHGALESLLQAARLGGPEAAAFATAPLLAAGARSPVKRVRHNVVAVLEARPRGEWGDVVEAAVRQNAEDDPDDDLRASFAALVAR